MITSTIYVAIDRLLPFLEKAAELGLKIGRSYTLSQDFDKVYLTVTCPSLEVYKASYPLFLDHCKPHDDTLQLKLCNLLKAVS